MTQEIKLEIFDELQRKVTSMQAQALMPVPYTHLDVYKRQVLYHPSLAKVRCHAGRNR